MTVAWRSVVERAALGLAMLAAGNAAPDAFDRARAALMNADRATTRGDRSGLVDSARALLASGAAPQSGTPDLARRWLGESRGNTASAYRDRPLGPGYRTIDLARGESARFDQIFLAGQRARVAVVPLGRARYTMKIVDDAQQNVCAASSARAPCDWVPSFTTRFSIEVRNAGAARANFVVVVQ